MRIFILLALYVCLLGCASAPRNSQDSLLESGKYHEAFLLWPITKSSEWLKDDVEGVLGLAYYQLIFRTACLGQKDWAGIFKDTKIPIDLKHDLLWDIHEGAVYGRDGPIDGWDWDEIEKTHVWLANSSIVEDEDQEGWSLHGQLLAYVKQGDSVCDEVYALRRRMGVLHGLVYAIRRKESELPSIFMDSHIPLSIKAHIILMLHGCQDM